MFKNKTNWFPFHKTFWADGTEYQWDGNLQGNNLLRNSVTVSSRLRIGRPEDPEFVTQHAETFNLYPQQMDTGGISQE